MRWKWWLITVMVIGGTLLALSCNTLKTNTPTPTAKVLAGKMELEQNETAFSINPAKIELANLQIQKPFRYEITVANNEDTAFEYQVKAQIPDYTDTGYQILIDNSTYRIEIPSESILVDPKSEGKAEIIVTKIKQTSDPYEGWIRIKQQSESQIRLEMISRLLLK